MQSIKEFVFEYDFPTDLIKIVNSIPNLEKLSLNKVKLRDFIDYLPSKTPFEEISNIKYLYMNIGYCNFCDCYGECYTECKCDFPNIPQCIEFLELDLINNVNIKLDNLPLGLKELTLLSYSVIPLNNLPVGLEKLHLRLTCIDYKDNKLKALDEVKTMIKLPFECKLYIDDKLVNTS